MSLSQLLFLCLKEVLVSGSTCYTVRERTEVLPPRLGKKGGQPWWAGQAYAEVGGGAERHQ